MGEDLKLKFIEDLGTHNVAKSGKKNMRRLWLVECPYCKRHFKINANNFLYNVKVGCPLCIKDKKDEKVRARQGAFIDKCVKVHGDNYDLSLIKYIGTNFPIEVVCPEHGSWFPIAYNFERGSGCPICAELKKECRYTDNPTLFYIFKINELYKVGITSKTLEGRYLGKDLTKEEFQNIELVFEYVFETGKPAFGLEQRLRHLFRDNLYKGDSPFRTTGISEVFTVCPDLDVVKSELSRILYETK